MRRKKGLSNGYILLYKPEHPLSNKVGYLVEHRFIASEKWGSEAVKDNCVHHINGIKTDNRIENLKILSPSDHVRLHSLGKKVAIKKILMSFKISIKIKKESSKIAEGKGISLSALINYLLAECIEKNKQ